MSITTYFNATVFTSALAESPAGAPAATGATAEAFAVADGRIISVGTLEEVRTGIRRLGQAQAEEVTEVDLQGSFVFPGFIDAHTHLLGFGEAMGKAQLRECTSLREIRETLLRWHEVHPQAPRILGCGWLFDAIGETHPTAAMLDDVFPDMPVYLDANDLHSVWVNTAALHEIGIDRHTPDPVGGEIARDTAGNATGLLYETAGVAYAQAFLESVSTPADQVACLDRAFAAYLEAGVTGATDMALTEATITALQTILNRDGRLPFPITGHLIVTAGPDPAAGIAQLQRATALRAELAAGELDPWFRLTGIKFILDGVIDARTATMCHPYADGSNAAPIWAPELLKPVALAADAAGLQMALHAIGDRTSEIAIEILEHCAAARASASASDLRHRIEHLETVTDHTVSRMARLGVVASMQPVHSDPAILGNWKAVLGDERQEQGFPWHRLREAGVAIALGTDAPTAPHSPLQNLYIALTGGSSLSPGLAPYHPERAFTPAAALTALTAAGAYAGHMPDVGQLRPGFQANFLELDLNPLEAEPSALLTAQVNRTYVLGEPVYTAPAR